MLGEVLKRLARIHRLLWMDERVSSLESEVSKLRKENNHLKAESKRLHSMVRQLSAFKLSLEVPEELVGEFFEWKARTPLPEEPLVSVVVATYNRARLLTERCIPSVLAQTYANLELIVVGDGCTDRTEDAVAGIGDPRLTFVNLPRRGRYPQEERRRWLVAGTPAMNRGMSMASGDFVTHLDDDDEYTPERIEKLVAFAAENGCDFLWHPFWAEDEWGNWQLVEAREFVRKQLTTSSVFYRSWFTRIEWSMDAHRLMEPGDWNRFRRIKYIGPSMMRHPEPLLRHYRQMSQE